MDESGMEAAEEELRFIESGGAFSFFDAIFAVAMTLLVTTITPPASAWTSFGDLWDASGNQFLAFGLSFLIIGHYWWANRRFLEGLRGITPRIVLVTMVLLAFVVLLPVVTNALGDTVAGSDRVTTVVYAVNIAAIACARMAQLVVAHRQGLIVPTLSTRAFRIRVLDEAVTPIVFLASIPVALSVSATAGRYMWALLLVLAPITGRLAGQAVNDAA